MGTLQTFQSGVLKHLPRLISLRRNVSSAMKFRQSPKSKTSKTDIVTVTFRMVIVARTMDHFVGKHAALPKFAIALGLHILTFALNHVKDVSVRATRGAATVKSSQNIQASLESLTHTAADQMGTLQTFQSGVLKHLPRLISLRRNVSSAMKFRQSPKSKTSKTDIVTVTFRMVIVARTMDHFVGKHAALPKFAIALG